MLSPVIYFRETVLAGDWTFFRDSFQPLQFHDSSMANIKATILGAVN